MGKSVVVNVQTPITRVLSSNPAVIETLATSRTEVVVEGRAAGTSSLILWDETGRSQMLDVIVDLDVTGLRTAIEHAYPNQQVQVQADGGRLLLTGNVPDAKAAEDLNKMATVYSPQVVSSLQVAALHERQILLEVKFAEVDRTKLQQFGFNLFSTGAANTIGTLGHAAIRQPDRRRHWLKGAIGAAEHRDHFHVSVQRLVEYFPVPAGHQSGSDHQGPAAKIRSGNSGRAQPDGGEWSEGKLPRRRRVSLPHRPAQPGIYHASPFNSSPSAYGWILPAQLATTT